MDRRLENTLRYDPASTKGHVESYFIRANHPSKPQALWLKATILAPKHGNPVAETWCIFFDGARQRIFSAKNTVPFSDTSWAEDLFIYNVQSQIAPFGHPLPNPPPSRGRGVDKRQTQTSFSFQNPGKSVGSLQTGEEACTWDITWQADPFRIANALSLYPTQRLVEAAFPVSKLLTPYPVLFVSGKLCVWGEEISIDHWLGMQGHNWGRAHPWEYAWGQCLFQNSAGAPVCMVEGFTGRVRVAGCVTPWISSVVVRHQEQEYRFDRLFDIWKQHATVGKHHWRVFLCNQMAKMELEMEAPPVLFAHLRYVNPDGRVSFCINSKLAAVRVKVIPKNADSFEYTSEHTGALEFLRNHAL